MDVWTVEMENYAERVYDRVWEDLRRFDIELDNDQYELLHSQIIAGAYRAREEGGQYWELTFRGSVEVMMERMLFLANKIDHISSHPQDSEVANEENRMLDRLTGSDYSVMSFCPCWPFC
jgi:hypothetical protein